MAKGNYDALAAVKTKTLGSGCKVQFNPARMVSTGAKMDAATLRERPCFLCAANRPIQQNTRPWADYEILVNPFPIFPRHFTVPLRAHSPQRIYGRVADMARLALKMPGYTVFYNGPRCGASAPDHMHFQAGNSDFLPIWQQLPAPTAPIAPVEVFGGMGVIMINGSSAQEVENLFAKVYALLPAADEEPMLNLLMRAELDAAGEPTGELTLLVVPRKRHRPTFYGVGPGQMVLSPASVDLGGVFITPRLEDFEAMDDATARQVYRELCMDLAEVSRVCERAMVPVVHVGILSEPKIEFVLHGPYRLDGDKVSGTVSLTAHGFGDEMLFTPMAQGCYVEVRDVMIGVNFHWQQRETQCFKGAVKVVKDDDLLVLINILPVDDYLTSVISSEMSATSQLELLKAHAVISRSWLLAQIQSRGSHEQSAHEQRPNAHTLVKWYDHDDHTLFDVCADDHCQRYQGITRQTTPVVAEAVKATAGQVLMHDGRLCDARFSKCCGGMMEEYEYCWDDTHKPYLQGIRDDAAEEHTPDLTTEDNARQWILSSPEAYCNTDNTEVLRQVLNGYDQTTSDFYRWTVTYSQADLSELVRRRTGVDFGRIHSLVPLRRGRSGRISLLRIDGEKAVMDIGKELEIRRVLSPTHLYSSAFVVDCDEQMNFTLHGAGWGHGVGLCQIGAAMMAHQGFSYRQILAHYYPGSILSTI